MANITRREALKVAGASAAVLAAGVLPATVRAAADEPKVHYPYTLPKLPYAYDALAPHIDKQTMQIHHDRHHQAYVDGLNAALKGHEELQKMSLESLLRNITKVPMAIRQRVINSGGGHYNHSMFWEIMSPKGGKPAGALADAINKSFTSVDGFKKQLKQAALGRFGSGWGWLVVDKGRLAIISSANQDCPLMDGKKPILGLDVWEHAYYLHYQNRRGDYIDAWWNVVNWPALGQRYAAAMKR